MILQYTFLFFFVQYTSKQQQNLIHRVQRLMLSNGATRGIWDDSKRDFFSDAYTILNRI